MSTDPQDNYCDECEGECEGVHAGRRMTEKDRVEQAANILLSNGYGFVEKVFEKVKELRAAAAAAKASEPTPS